MQCPAKNNQACYAWTSFKVFKTRIHLAFVSNIQFNLAIMIHHPTW